MSASTIHVEPNAKGRWIVRYEGEREPLSEHESTTSAERVARTLAQHEQAAFVLVHDRYMRTHRLPIEDGAAACERGYPKPPGAPGPSDEDTA